jgi:hypothetical protein
MGRLVETYNGTVDAAEIARAWRALQRSDCLLAIADGTPLGRASRFADTWLVNEGVATREPDGTYRLTRKGRAETIAMLLAEGDRLHADNRRILEMLQAQDGD